MIYPSRKRPLTNPHRCRQRVFYAVGQRKSEAERKAALQAALKEVEKRFGLGAIKKGNEIECVD